MAKFNTRSTAGSPDVVNKEGAPAYALSPEMELYTRTCASFLEDKFYAPASEEAARLADLVKSVGREFTLKLAAYARQQMNIRSIPVALLVEAALLEDDKGEAKPDVRAYVPRILRRADEPMEAVAYWKARTGSPGRRGPSTLPASLKKGISDTLSGFDEYQLAKWDKSGASVSLRDVFRLCHPSAGDDPERRALYARVMEGTLRSRGTWEFEVAEAARVARAEGGDPEAAKQVAFDLAAERMGMMALMRNMRNFERLGAKRAISVATEAFLDGERVRRSRILPFRWVAAAREVGSIPVRDALHAAADHAVASAPKWSGETVIMVDLSGSMNGSVSQKSVMTLKDVASVLAAILVRARSASWVGAFASQFAWVGVSSRDSVVGTAERIRATSVGGATYAHLGIEKMVKDNHLCDRVVLLSDEQCYDHSCGWSDGVRVQEAWREYRRRVNERARLYSIDLAGYGTTPFNLRSSDNVLMLAGWSERLLEMVPALEAGAKVVDHIRENW